jgi:hypothetical protein
MFCTLRSDMAGGERRGELFLRQACFAHSDQTWREKGELLVRQACFCIYEKGGGGGGFWQAGRHVCSNRMEEYSR